MELEKLNQNQEIELLKEIDKNYADLKLPIIEPIYKNGKIVNEKEIKAKLKQFITLISALWLTNSIIIDNKSSTIVSNTFTYYNALKTTTGAQFKITITELTKLSKKTMNNDKWYKIMNKIIVDRQNKVKIKQVIKGNINILNKRVQKLVQNMYKSGKSKPQIKKALIKEFGYNKNKAKSIAITEVNYYKSKAQLEATDGLKIKKTWIHNGSKEPRESHLMANGQEVIGRDTYFNVGGKKTLGPQQFGIASEDINCHCTMRIDVID